MNDSPIRQFLTGVLTPVLLLSAPAVSDAAVEIVSPQGVRDRFIVERDGRLILDVDGMSWELVTDPDDPAISRLGDGSFHPMSPMLVHEAIRELDRVALGIEGRILILPRIRAAPI